MPSAIPHRRAQTVHNSSGPTGDCSLDESLFDIFWMLLAGALVFMMQAGFMCLESGMTRSKNSINVAIKNMTDFAVSFVLFWAFGFGLMFGVSQSGWFGMGSFFLPFETVGPWLAAFFFFQAMFVATATTILSGAIAERARFGAYILITVMVSGFIYPIAGHWTWGSAAGGETEGWLAARGFVDFAGSTVVHSVGGWVSLAALLVLGARAGRFGEDGSVRKITGHNLPLTVMGALLLYFGWFGFNGGSTLTFDVSVAAIIANTALAGAAGASACLAFGWSWNRRPDVELVVNGALAGLVAITANCHVVTAQSAFIIGAVGGCITFLGERLLERLRVDDAVGAIPVHLFAGAWGTMAVALFGIPELIGTGLPFVEQLQVQAIGVLSYGVWAFSIAFGVLWLVNKVWPLRISPESEHIGLNVAEHGASTELIDLLNAMERQGRAGDLSIRVPVEPFTEVGQIAKRYNFVMDLLQRAVTRAESVVRDIQDGILTIAADGRLTSVNPGAEKLFGYRIDEAIGKPLAVLFAGPPMGDSSGLDLNRIARGSTGAGAIELPARHKSGHVFPVEMKLAPSGGDGTAYTALVKDITERKRAEDALQASRDRMLRHAQALASLAAAEARVRADFAAMLAEIARVAASTLDARRMTIWRAMGAGTRFERVYASDDPEGPAETPVALDLSESHALRKAIGAERLVVVHDTWNDERVSELWGKYLAKRQIGALMIARVMAGGEAWGMLFIEHGDKRGWKPEEQQFMGSMADYVSLAIEDSHRRKAEATAREANLRLEERVEERTLELQQANEELHKTINLLGQTQSQLVQSEKMAALGDMVAGIAHEINTPVGVALTAASHLEQKARQLAEALQEGALKKSTLDGFVDTSSESTMILLNNLTRASELVQSFKRVAVDQSSEARRPFNVKDYVGEILLSLRPRLKRLTHQIEVTAPDDLTMNSYPGAFSQVVTNLVVNAIVHAFDENETGTIRMHFESVDNQAVFTFTDNGKGISPEHLPKIFDPFFTTKRGHGGSGLGLHLVFNIVTQSLGGTIQCDSQEGKGTRFMLHLPLEPTNGEAS